MGKPKLGLVTGSVRDSRFADKAADWILDLASRRDGLPPPRRG